MIQASIITIGDELLIGQVIDTNSSWMAQELNKAGIWVQRRVAVGDQWQQIWNALDQESETSEIILITGGLGPTEDDITKTLLCEYFGGKLIVDLDAMANVKYIFEQVLKRPMIERNQKQAEVPDNCKVIQNKRGTAPGMWFEKNGKIFVSMPGVPFEMKGMMETDIIPRLKNVFILPAILHRTLLVAGIGESFLAEHIKTFEQSLPKNIRLAYLPNYGMLRLRLTATGNAREALEGELNSLFGQLKSLVTEWIVTDQDIPLQEELGKILTAKGKTVCTAESCTGGYIAHLITSVAGSSNYFIGSIVSYANEVKENILGVQAQTILDHGAVSEETVREMVGGALNLLKTDFAVASSGIMGPGGGSIEKPVGTVWIAAGNHEKITAQKLYFRFDRQRNIDLTSNYALNLLRKFILENP
ncbi:MAG: CinA family nicotinamide mononucleotide deamidase-related protein [Chitinophagales bacterium]